MSSPTVLVLDGELGFIFALSVELSKRHISVVPARTARDARSTLARLRLEPELLVIKCSRPGACALAEELTRKNPELRMVGIVSDRYQCTKCASRIAARLRDPEDQVPERIADCADLIEELVKAQQRKSHRAGIDC